MDTDLLRTFLEVNRTRHFGRAAENLCLTPSAVSARIRLLESQLGVQLLTRQRNDIRLTTAGERFLAHANVVLSLWEKARQEATLGDQKRQLVVAAPQGLWDSLGSNWPQRLWQELPQLTLRLEVSNSVAIRDALARSLIDLGLTFDRPCVPEIVVRELMEVTLRLYATGRASDGGSVLGDDYILVDWGSAFAGQHVRWFPEVSAPRARVSTGRLALTLLEKTEGKAFLTESMAAAAVAAGRLSAVETVPSYTLPVLAAWREDSYLSEEIQRVIELIARQRQVGSSAALAE
jgi:DNA-binding transcriptional LysR family regulator